MADFKDFLMIRNRPKDGTAAIQVWKKSSSPDLTDYAFLRTGDNGMDEYVHKDDYEIYKKIFEKKDKENGVD